MLSLHVTRSYLGKYLLTARKMDPYVIIKIGDKTFKTDVHSSGGKTPKWTNVYEFNRKTEETMEFEVYDKDRLSDDLVGKGSLSISSICNGPTRTFSGGVPIYYKDKQAGELFLEINFYPDAPAVGAGRGMPQPQYPPGYPPRTSIFN